MPAENVMNDFEYEVRQRKILARQSRYKKNGSKSRRCSLSSDRMTDKQWKERCGAIMVYNLGKPMMWQEFKEMPSDMQKEYIESLIQKYSVTASDLARMFGCRPSSVTRLCREPEIDIEFKAGKRMTAEQRVRFGEFLSCVGDGLMCDPEHVDVEKAPESIVVESEEPKRSMAMSEFSIQFSGPFNPEMFYNSIRHIIPSGTDVEIEVEVKFKP